MVFLPPTPPTPEAAAALAEPKGLAAAPEEEARAVQLLADVRDRLRSLGAEAMRGPWWGKNVGGCL